MTLSLGSNSVESFDVTLIGDWFGPTCSVRKDRSYSVSKNPVAPVARPVVAVAISGVELLLNDSLGAGRWLVIDNHASAAGKRTSLVSSGFEAFALFGFHPSISNFLEILLLL